MIRSSALLIMAFGASLSAAPQLILTTTSIGPVHIFPGTNGATQNSEAFNPGSGSLNLRTSVSALWLAASVGAPTACTTRAGVCNPIAISLNTAALAAGVYTGYVTLTDPNAIDSPQQISVSINVAGIPASLTEYVTPIGGPTPAAFTSIFTQGPVTGSVTTQTGGNWLLFTTGGFINLGTPYGIQVASNNGIAPGSYTGSVVLSGSAADSKTINVTLNVTSSPIVVPVTDPVLLRGFRGGPKPSSSVSFTNIGTGTLSITGAAGSSSSGNFLSATVSSGNSIAITADPGTLAPGTYTGAVTITSNAANNSQISVPVVFTVEDPGIPLIYSAGVVNIGNFSSDAAAPGEILAIFGDQLATHGTFAQNPGKPPLATTLGGVQVLVNSVPAPLYFTSAGQINFQLPYEVPVGQVASVQVVANGTPGNLRPLNVVPSVPRLLVWPASLVPNNLGILQGAYGIIVNQDFSLVLPPSSTIPGFTSHPAKPGDTITIYCAGLGQTSPAAITGAAATSTPLESVSNVTVTFGGGFQGTPTTVDALFAGLTPTAVGLYQVNATLPPDVPVGALVPVTVAVNGTPSNFVYIAVSQ